MSRKKINDPVINSLRKKLVKKIIRKFDLDKQPVKRDLFNTNEFKDYIDKHVNAIRLLFPINDIFYRPTKNTQLSIFKYIIRMTNTYKIKVKQKIIVIDKKPVSQYYWRFVPIL